MTALENVLFSVLLIGFIALFSMAVIGCIGFGVIMAIEFVKDHFKERGADNDT